MLRVLSFARGHSPQMASSGSRAGELTEGADLDAGILSSSLGLGVPSSHKGPTFHFP